MNTRKEALKLIETLCKANARNNTIEAQCAYDQLQSLCDYEQLQSLCDSENVCFNTTLTDIHAIRVVENSRMSDNSIRVVENSIMYDNSIRHVEN